MSTDVPMIDPAAAPSPEVDCGGACHHVFERADRRTFLREAFTVASALAGLAALAPVSALQALTVEPAGTVRYAIPTADSVSIDAKNEVILCRANGEVFAFALSCPHQNTALRALPGNKGFQCPRHKSRYQPNGTFINGKATRNMDRLPISRDGGEVVVDPAVAYASDTQLEQWRNAVVRVS